MEDVVTISEAKVLINWGLMESYRTNMPGRSMFVQFAAIRMVKEMTAGLFPGRDENAEVTAAEIFEEVRQIILRDPNMAKGMDGQHIRGLKLEEQADMLAMDVIKRLALREAENIRTILIEQAAKEE